LFSNENTIRGFMHKKLTDTIYRYFLLCMVSFFSLQGNSNQIDPHRLAKDFGDAFGKSLASGLEKAAAKSSGKIAHGISKETVDGIMRD